MKRTVLFVAILLVAGVITVRHARQIREVRKSSEELSQQLNQTRIQTDAARAALRALQHELDVQRSERDAVSSRSAEVAQEIALMESSDRWSAPPETLPSWETESPYIWIEKKKLPMFPLRPFAANGQLDSRVAEVLVMSSEQAKTMNHALSQIVAEYRTQEAAHTVPTDEHLPGIDGAEGDKVTIVVEPMPDVSARLREQFEGTLWDQLGAQRASLVLEASEGWMQEQLGWVSHESEAAAPEPRTFSVVRWPNGTYNVAVRSGHTWMSVGGVSSLTHQIPAHLRHFFAEIETPREEP
jgi:hypothetical protein